MPKRIWIFTGGRPSNSAKALAEADANFRRYITGKGFKPGDTLVNWGTSKLWPGAEDCVINTATAVGLAANKYHAFTAMAGADVETVPWTANKAVAKEWQAKDATIVVRNKLTGHSGEGIIIVEAGAELPDAPLYTKYIFKVREYRVHATKTGVIDTQRKVRDPDREPTTWKVRSYDNGFIYQRNGITPSKARDDLAIAAVKALGLDFGAVDIVEDKHGKFFVLEINTAPGLEGQTVTIYINALKELSNGAAVA